MEAKNFDSHEIRKQQYWKGYVPFLLSYKDMFFSGNRLSNTAIEKFPFYFVFLFGRKGDGSPFSLLCIVQEPKTLEYIPVPDSIHSLFILYLFYTQDQE